MTVENLSKTITPAGLQVEWPYYGRVVNNNDPDQLGRVRVRVEDLYNAVPDDDLPWARPEGMYHVSGAGPDSGGFTVPEVGTQVKVLFHSDDSHKPYYTNYDVSNDTLPAEVKEDYPFTHLLFKFITDTKMWYNRKKKLLRFKNVQDAELENTRNVKIKVGGNVVIDVDGTGTITIKGATRIICPENITVDTPLTTFTGDVTVKGVFTAE